MKRIAVLLILLSPIVSQASPPSYANCHGSNITCSQERVTERDSRPYRRVDQPAVSGQVMGSCGQPLPSTKSYRATNKDILCGEGSVSRDRFPKDFSAVLDEWDSTIRAAYPGAQEDAQRLRETNESWQGVIDIPAYEQWTWTELVGGFRGDKCGYESYQTTCAVTRTERYYTDNWVDSSECERWEEFEDPVSTSDGGSSGIGSSSGSSWGGSSSGSSSGSSGSSSSDQGRGESSSEIESRGMDYYNDDSSTWAPSYSENINRSPAGRRCVAYKKVNEPIPHDRALPSVSYPCTSQRGKWCTWTETRNERRTCPNMRIGYNIQYKHDSNWKPGYTVPGKPERNYHFLLPNKWDLLIGESESVVAYANTGFKTVMQPTIAIRSRYNEYRVDRLAPVRCEYGVKPTIQYGINTVGRIKTKAPNPLAIPVDPQGRPVALNYTNVNLGTVRERPSMITLRDRTRATMLAASLESRVYARPVEAPVMTPGAHARRAANETQIGDATKNGFWVDTQFRIQLFRKDRRQRWVRLTQPTTFNQDAAKYDMLETLQVGLNGRAAIRNFYRPSGLLDPVFGGLYERFGTELTPNQNYFIRVQVVNRGLPFYESGCKGGKTTCEGEEASLKTFTDPIYIQFKYTPDRDTRSLWKRFKDFQENGLLF